MYVVPCKYLFWLLPRLCSLIYLAASQGVGFILEQPCSSLIAFHPVFESLIHILGAQRVFLHMGAYGGCTPKPTLLYGTVPWLQELRRTQTRAEMQQLAEEHGLDVTRTYLDSQGQVRVQGGAHLKSTQAYPNALGLAVAMCVDACLSSTGSRCI